MHSETKSFSEFVDFLKMKKVLSDNEINDALSFLDGLEGILSEHTFILGYQGLAYHINRKLSFHELKNFISQNTDLLAQDAETRYFFAQSLVDAPKLTDTERATLIRLMPEIYQPFLFRRFARSC